MFTTKDIRKRCASYLLAFKGTNFSAPRCFAYSTDNPFFNSIQHQKHSGVGMYCKNNIRNVQNIAINVNIESIICQFKKPDMIIVVSYWPAQYHLLFKTYITKLCNTLSNRSDNIFLLGDWNHDELKTQCQHSRQNLGMCSASQSLPLKMEH